MTIYVCKSISLVQTHEDLFLNVGFFATQILGIPKSQIQTKRKFNLVGVLRTTMKHWHLQMENFDQIIPMTKNQFDVSCLNCTPNANLKNYMKAKSVLVKENHQLVKEVECFKELQVDKDQTIDLNLKPQLLVLIVFFLFI